MSQHSKENLSALALTTFTLNGQFLAIAEHLASQVGLTATRWQVLGAVIDEPLTQAEVARRMGITRQSVQRTSHQLIDAGLLKFKENPSHQKAMLLELTATGHDSLSTITPYHTKYAQKIMTLIGPERMEQMVEMVKELSTILDGSSMVRESGN